MLLSIEQRLIICERARLCSQRALLYVCSVRHYARTQQTYTFCVAQQQRGEAALLNLKASTFLLPC